MDPLPKRLFGIFLVILAIFTLVQAVRQVVQLPYTLASPCLGDENIREEGMDAGTRIAYCLSFWPFNMNGGGVYALGTSNQDEASVVRLRFRRDGELLYVNSRPVHVGGVYKTIQWSLIGNPWLIYRDHLEIRNEGLISVDSVAAPDVLFISGDVQKGWLPSPIGFIMLIAGMVLLLRQPPSQ